MLQKALLVSEAACQSVQIATQPEAKACKIKFPHHQKEKREADGIEQKTFINAIFFEVERSISGEAIIL